MANNILERSSRLEKAKEQLVSKKDVDQRVVIVNALTKMFPGMSIQEAAKTSRDMVLYPSASTVKVNGEDIKVGELQYQVATTIEHLGSTRKKDPVGKEFEDKLNQSAQTLEMRQKLGKVEATRAARAALTGSPSAQVKVNEDLSTHDMQYRLAESLELLNSETYSQQEYFDWFAETDKIMKDMNDGDVTEVDLKNRNKWIDDSFTREAEMMTCMGLYKSSASKDAQQKYADIYNKLIKMRQLRSGIRETTQNHVDKPKGVNHEQKLSAYGKAQLYREALKGFTKNGVRWNLPKSKLEELKMYHGNDDEFSSNYALFYDEYEKAVLEAERNQTEQDRAEQERKANEERMKNSYAFDDVLKAKTLAGLYTAHSAANNHSNAEAFLAKTQGGETQTQESVADRIMRLTGRRPPLNNHEKHAFNKDRFLEQNKVYMMKKAGLVR